MLGFVIGAVAVVAVGFLVWKLTSGHKSVTSVPTVKPTTPAPVAPATPAKDPAVTKPGNPPVNKP